MIFGRRRDTVEGTVATPDQDGVATVRLLRRQMDDLSDEMKALRSRFESLQLRLTTECRSLRNAIDQIDQSNYLDQDEEPEET